MKDRQFLLFVALIHLFHYDSHGFVLNLSVLKQCLNRSNEKCDIKSVTDEYIKNRNQFIANETEQGFGMDIELNENEKIANEIIMEAKYKEISVGLQDPNAFNPSRHIFEVMDKIKQSELFKIIQKMPKGGLLHIHNLAICSIDYVVSLTHWPNLWQYSAFNSTNIDQFQFSRQQPASKMNTNNTLTGVWRLVSDVRTEIGSSKYDENVRKLFTLYDKAIDPRTENTNQLWDRLERIFSLAGMILTYAPVHRAYYIETMKEMLADGVQYMEFRGSLWLYDLDGRILDVNEIVSMYFEMQNEFKRENPSFIGTKLIYAGRKVFDTRTMELTFERIQRLHNQFPTFLAGFDLIGQEDTAPTLLSFADKIINLPNEIKLFFHAGETNWFGSVDENLVDAILLGAKRIGHGYSLVKHPNLLSAVKANDIAIEVNPVSNQILGLVDDFRNHPASTFLAQNISIVISSDDPSFWETTPLSHDFYITFLGIASQKSDLRVLKKFAINSLRYSSMNDIEKKMAFTEWQLKWDQFIENVISDRIKVQ